MTKSRIMVVGDYMWPWYQEACAKALENLDIDVERFGWNDDFYFWIESSSEPVYHSFLHRFQARFLIGPLIWKINKRLLDRVKVIQPQIIWFYNVQIIYPTTVKKIRKALPNVVMIQYANDNPFSKNAKFGLWRNYLNSVKYFDIHLLYRNSNLQDYLNHGAKKIYLLRSYFIPYFDYHIPTKLVPKSFICDIVFAGHYEDDGRVEYLEEICNAGFKLNLFGGGWGAAKLKPNSPLLKYYPIKPVTNEDYRFAICGAKIALSLLSTLNQDTYTRRNFQIPAMKVAMLSQYTEDLANLFEEDREIVFFRDKNELISQIKRLLSDDVWRTKIAEGGYAKVYNHGHDVESRMRYLLDRVILNFSKFD